MNFSDDKHLTDLSCLCDIKTIEFIVECVFSILDNLANNIDIATQEVGETIILKNRSACGLTASPILILG